MTPALGDDTDDMTEIHDATFDRVDLVREAANGTRFLMAKSSAAGTPARIGARRAVQARSPVHKASPALLPVYNESGVLAGWVDPANLKPMADAPGKADPAPAPSASVGTPAAAVAKAAGPPRDRYDRLISKLDPAVRDDWNRAVVAALGPLRAATGCDLVSAATLTKSIAADLLSRPGRRVSADDLGAIAAAFAAKSSKSGVSAGRR